MNLLINNVITSLNKRLIALKALDLISFSSDDENIYKTLNILPKNFLLQQIHHFEW